MHLKIHTMKKSYLLLITLLFTQFFTQGQNLMVNGSFEDYNVCPLYGNPWYYTPSKVTGWTNVTNHTGSADMFNPCDWQTPSNFPTSNQWGNQAPCDGDSYVGFYMTMVESSTPLSWREYIVGSFTTPLTAGVTYNLSFCVSLADEMKYGSDHIEWMFSNTIPEVDVSVYTTSSQQHRFLSTYGYTPSGGYYGTPITTKNGWTTVSGTYTAAGGEMYLTLGNFYNTNSTNVAATSGSNSNGNSYYYLDNVVLTPIVPLGVDLRSFYINCSSSESLVQWIVDEESNNDFYTLEFSENGLDWESQITVDGKGTTNVEHIYTATIPASYFRKYSYVKLSQTNFNGEISVLTTEVLKCFDDSISIYPNPFEDIIYLTANQNGTLEIYDSTGKIVSTSNIYKGKQTIETNDLAPGIYLAHLILANESQKTIKLIKRNK